MYYRYIRYRFLSGMIYCMYMLYHRYIWYMFLSNMNIFSTRRKVSFEGGGIYAWGRLLPSRFLYYISLPFSYTSYKPLNILNSKTIHVLPSLDPSLIFSFHLLHSPVPVLLSLDPSLMFPFLLILFPVGQPTGFSFGFFPGWLAIFTLLSSKNSPTMLYPKTLDETLIDCLENRFRNVRWLNAHREFSKSY